MDLHIYNGEKFERSKRWYIGFSIVFISAIVLSLLNQNIVGALILFFILGAYFYYSIIGNQTSKIHIEDQYLIIDKKSHPWSDFTGYSLEIEKTSNTIKNIVLLYPKGFTIYTIKDTKEQIKEFSKELDKHIPLVHEYNQSLLEKLIRLLKL